MWLERFRKFRNNRAKLFVFSIFFIYAFWKCFFYFVHHGNSSAKAAWAKFVYLLGAAYATATSFVLGIYGEHVTHDGILVLYIYPARIIRVEEHCLAIPATVIFIGTVLAFQGAWKNKAWFIPAGILLIVLINLVRLVLLCYIFAHFTKDFFDINHSLVFVAITYSLVFVLLVMWMTRFSEVKSKVNEV